MIKFNLLSRELGKRVLSTTDNYIESMNSFERRIKFDREGDIDKKEYLEVLDSCVMDFTHGDRDKLAYGIKKLSSQLRELGIGYPESVNIIRTDGRDEWNSAYTRGNNIILPTKKLEYGIEELYELLVHEFFHVYSRFNPEIREKLYNLLGFEVISKSNVPEKILKQTLTNPDAMTTVAMSNCNGENMTMLIPLITADNGVDSNQDIMKSIRVRVYNSREEKLYDIDEVGNMKKVLATNNVGVQHPEETLAENFTFLLANKPVCDKEFLTAISVIIKA